MAAVLAVAVLEALATLMLNPRTMVRAAVVLAVAVAAPTRAGVVQKGQDGTVDFRDREGMVGFTPPDTFPVPHSATPRCPVALPMFWTLYKWHP